ncbi:TetR/AcrR family transcriptional regulator [Paenibacillus doosanensis]|nr:TetR/AcrR family transcriptional regulator [Paenibacillus doosanensis]
MRDLPRNVERDQEARKERCEQILSVAVQLIAQKGLEATKISDIAAKVGISHGLVYNYFQSKEELFASLLNKNLDSLRHHLEQVVKLPGPALEKLTALVENMLRNQWDDALFHQMFIDQILTSDSIGEELKQSVRERISDNLDIIAALFREGQKEGSILDGDPRQHSLVLMSCIRSATLFKRRELYVRFDAQSILRYFVAR